MDANLNRSGDQAFIYLGDKVFTGHAGELRCAAGIVWGDVNGDKVADFAIKVLGVSTLTANEFLL